METTHEARWTNRALAAHYHTGATGEPTRPNSRVRTVAGLTYVVLAEPDRIVGVYRVHNNGQLRRMKQPPMEVMA